VAVDIAPGQTLFVTLRSDVSHGWAAGIMSGVIPKPDDPSISREDRFGAHMEAVRANRKLNIVPRWFPPRHSADDPVTGYPIMVRFRDTRDPASVEQVNPDDLATSFGPGVRLRRITVQLTDDPYYDRDQKAIGMAKQASRTSPAIYSCGRRGRSDIRAEALSWRFCEGIERRCSENGHITDA
jgi:hypothetical protein